MSGSESTNIYRCTPRQVRGFILDVLEAELVPFLRSSPGMGKSSIVKSIADEANLHMIDHRLSTSEPTDMTGLPQFVNGMARFAPFDELFPITNTPIPKGKNGWIVFLDEFNSAKKDVQAASYKLILDKKVGQHDLHENVAMVLAGNLDTDRAITTTISTAMQSRVIHLEMTISFQEWLEDVAFAQNYDSRIIAFLSQYESKLMDFKPDHKEKTFCCPRTWEFMNRLIKNKEVTEEKVPLYAGTITNPIAVEFAQFTRVFKDVPKLRDILANPDTYPVPYDNNIKWATICHLMEKVDEKNFGALATYANRFDLSFRLLFHRSNMARNPHLRHHPAFTQGAVSLSKYLAA